jgi:pimeloyl-ACP methyl ester carboxylesterase
MKLILAPGGVRVSYDEYGSGPPLVLVHGSFSDHRTNWEFVKPILRKRFTVYAIARRGRGETNATDAHSLDDEVGDLLAVIQAVGKPLFLLGHSYGAHCSLAAAALAPDNVSKLVLYEPVWPSILSREALGRLEEFASAGAWDDFVITFFRDRLLVPVAELEQVRASELWPPIIADAGASLGDLRALSRYAFKAERFSRIKCPVLLQIGSESPRHLYVTDALSAALPDVRIEELPGQAHEGMTTAPELYAQSVTTFLLG